jgi:hypothetical protein
MQWFWWFIAIILSLAAGYWIFLADKKREVPYPWLTALLRSLVIFLCLLLVLSPVITVTKHETKKPVIVFLQDNSASIAHSLGKDTTAYRQNASQLLDKLSKQYDVVKWGFGNKIQKDSIFQYRQQSTDIAAALAAVQEFYGIQNLGAVVLASDGRFNEGVNPLFKQLSLQSPVYSVGLGDSAATRDLRIAQSFANKTTSLNSSFEIRADIVAAMCKGYNNSVQLSENGNVLSTVSLSVSNDRYDRSVSFTVRADKAGLHHYAISVPPAEGEQNIANNRRDVFVEVRDEKKNILIVAAAPHPDIKAIREALSGLETYKVTVKQINEVSSTEGYDILILHQTPVIEDNLARELRSTRKPVWYILGAQTNPALLSQFKKPVAVNINPAIPQDVFAAFNSSFNSFTLPQSIQTVMDKMPPLSIPSGTIQAVDANILFGRRGEEQSPLWVLQQGTVPTALLAGEGLWRWRIYEYKNFNRHEVVDECIRQTISFLSVDNEKPFSLQLPKYVWSDQEAITLNAYLLNANNEQVNTPEVKLIIADSAGRKQQFSFERSGSAYRLNIGIWAGGNYTCMAQTNYNGKSYSASASFVVQSMPLELMETGADYPLLYSLAKKYNGGFVPAAAVGSLYDSLTKNQQIKPMIQSDIQTVPLVDWKWYFFLILLFATAEWLLRKYWLAM